MKRLINKIKDVLTDDATLDVLFYIAFVLWFGFVGRFIIVSELHIIAKILLIIGDLWWAFYTFMLHYGSNKE